MSIPVGELTLVSAFHESTGNFSVVAPARVAAVVEGISIISQLCPSVRSSVSARPTLHLAAHSKAKEAVAGIAGVLEGIFVVVGPSLVCAGGGFRG